MAERFGPYELHELLGRGGMGEVWRASDTRRGRVVAVKRLLPSMTEDDGFRIRFQRESKLAARLHDPHVLPVHDFGEIDGRLFIDMRFVQGQDFGSALRAVPWSPSRVVWVVEQIAAALDDAHTNGLLHRDVKPSNVLLSGPADFAYLIDFGIARALDSTRVTSTGLTSGTLAYMAPEAFEDRAVDARVDVYALGCVLYEALTGSTPFAGRSPAALVHAHLYEDPVPPSARAPVPRAFDAVVAAALAKEPNDRTGSAGEVAAAARRALDGDGPSASADRPVALPPRFRPPRPPVPEALDPPSPGRRWPRARVTVAVVATLVLLAVATVVGVGILRPRADPVAAGGDGSGGNSGVVLPAGDGTARCAPGTSLGYLGTLNGQNAALGVSIANGAQLAVDQHNRANPGCQVRLAREDSGGTADTAPDPTARMVADPSVLGVVGLPFSGESMRVGPVLDAAGLPWLTPSATNSGLSRRGWRTFFRGLGDDLVQGPAAAGYLSRDLGAATVCVIEDDSQYGRELGEAGAAAVGPSVASCRLQVATDQTDFSAVVAAVRQAAPQAVLYGGYYPEAGGLLRQLREAGVTASFLAGDGSKDQGFVDAAGGRADGAMITCPCAPGDSFPAFAAEYRAAFATPPETYAPEAYDLATILLVGIDHGVTTRAGMLDHVRRYDGQGLTKRFRWGPSGEPVDAPIWLYRVVGGTIVADRRVV